MLAQKIKQIKIILEDFKAQDISVISLPEASYEVCSIIVVTATSTIHGKSMAKNLKSQAKLQQLDYLGIEGEDNGQWVLVDLNDVVVHIMIKPTRELYQLESLWDEAKVL